MDNRPKVGAVLELKAGAGLAYALYTHKDPIYSYLMRVRSKILDVRPRDFASYFSDDVDFSCFYPLDTALRRGLVEVVGQIEIPNGLRTFRIFPGGTPNRENDIPNWRFGEVESESRGGNINDDQRKIPVEWIWNHTFLIDRVNKGWRGDMVPLQWKY
jgi:hypothetical protein